MPTYMAEKSALARVEKSAEVSAVVDPLLLEGKVATCGMVDLEMLYSAETPRAYAYYEALAKRLAKVLRRRPTVI